MFIVAQVMSSSGCLSIVARSELGSDLDCYELKFSLEKMIYISASTYNAMVKSTCCDEIG